MVELKEKRLRKSLSKAKNEWQGQKDLNPRHAVLETAALPTELYPCIRSLQVYVTLATNMAEKMGFEPMRPLRTLTV